MKDHSDREITHADIIELLNRQAKTIDNIITVLQVHQRILDRLFDPAQPPRKSDLLQ